MASSHDFCHLLNLTQADIKNKQDSLPRPPKTLPTECNPYFCTSKHTIHHSPQELEDFLLSELKSSLPMRQVIAFANSQAAAFTRTISIYVHETSLPGVGSPQNKNATKSFRKRMNQVAGATFDRRDKDSLHVLFSYYMLNLGNLQIPCLREVNINELAQGLLQITSTPSEILDMLSHGQHERDMKAKGWNDQQMVTFSTSLLDIIKKIVQTASTPNCLISRWFDFIFNFIIPSLSATRFVDYARMSRTLSNLKMSGTIPRDKLMIAGLYNEAMAPWRNTEVDLHYPHYFEAEEIRDEADVFCEMKQDGTTPNQVEYIAAVACYEEINFLALGPQPLLLHSLLNCATSRLECADNQPLQIPLAILDCCRALDIDQNNTKALLTRGKGLVRLKRWNEAIADFERAVELDPNSPAKKELRNARGSVTWAESLYSCVLS